VLSTILTKPALALIGGLLLFLITESGYGQVSTFTSNVATGNWNAPGSWTEVGSDVDNIPDGDDIVIILSGDNIFLNGARSANSVTINAGGILTANGGGLTVGTMSVSGTYNHAINGGNIPTATWAAVSNVIISGVTNTSPTGLNQSFGNFTWNSSGQTGNVYMQSNITVQSNFSVLDTGLPLDPTNRALRMSNTGAGYTINVAGDFNITNSTFKMNNGTGSCTLNVGGDFNLNSGNVTIVTGNANSTVSVTGDVNIAGGTMDMQEDGSGSVGTLNVTGNFNHTGGTITESGGGSGVIVFNNAGIQTFTSGGSITNTVNLTINSGTTLQTAAAGTIIGGNDFTLSPGATLGIRSTAGITTAGATGNVQSTGTRSYSTTASYIYNGSANQSVGNGLPATVSNLTIANTGGGGNNTVTLVNNLAISNALSVNNGVLAMGANNITTVGSVNMTGTSITGTGTLTLAGNVTTNASGTTAGINAPIALGGSTRTFTVPDGGAAPDLQISSPISGAAGFIKAGTGLLNIFGANSYLGLTSISDGILRIGSLSALGSTAAGTIISNGAGLDLSGLNYTAAEPLTINGTGISGGGSIFNSSATAATFGGIISLGSPSTIVTDNQITISNTLSATFDLTKGGTNALVFTTNPVSLNNLIVASGTLTSTSGTLTISGTFSNSGTFNNNGGTVLYDGTSQTITDLIYNNLSINQSAGQASLGGAVTVNGVLTMTNGILNLNGFDLTLGTAASISIAAPSATKMILVTSGNKVIKTYSATGSFTFPIGENTGVAEYSPITVNVTAGAGFPATLEAAVFDLKHPNNSSTTNFLTRYWEVTSNITGGVATVSTTYPSADVTGTEGSISAAQLPGVFDQTSNPWIKYSVLGANTLTATAAPLTSGQTNAFTGITGVAPTATIVGGGVTICAGASVNLSTNVTGDPTFTYSWSPALGLSATNISNPIATPHITTVYTATARDGNGITATDNTTITIDTPPTPTIGSSGSTVCDGVNPDVTLTSSAAPNGGTYVWYKGGIATGDVGISLAVNDPAGSGSYTVRVIDGISSCTSAQSAAEVVIINPLPVDKAVSALTALTICDGGTITIRITASEPGINYEIQDQLNNPVRAIAGGTGANLDLTTNSLTASVTSLKVVATNVATVCSRTLTNTIGPVTVNPIPVTPTINPVGPVVVCEGTAAIVLTSSAGAGNQWYKDGALIGGATLTTLNITTAPGNSGSYTVISTVSGCSSLVSAATSVTINPLPLTTPIVTPATPTVCNGSTVTVNVAGSQAGINYELFDGGTSLSSTTAGTGGAINLVTSALTANTTITVRATNPVTGCSVLLTGTSVVTVNPIPVTPTINPVGPVVVCEGTAAIVLTSSAGAGNQWYKDGALIGGATLTTLNITTTPGNSGSYTVISTVSGCSSLVSAATSVTINPLPLTTPIVTPATPTVCNGSTVTVNVAGSQAGINYELFDGGTSLSSTTAGTGGAINLVTSALTANTTITVRATNPVTGCSVLLTGTSVVTVNPIPVTPTINPVGPVVVCEGTAAIVLTSSAGAGNQWYKDGALIGGATLTTLNITTTPGNSGSYTVISTVSGCSSLVSAATSVTINPLPLTTPIVTPATPTVCNGSTVTVNVAGSQAGINYELFDGGTSLSSTTAGTGGAINLVTSALTANTTITVRATNPVTGCSVLLTGTSVVTVNPIPVTPTINPVGPVVVCEGTAAIVQRQHGNEQCRCRQPMV
jgi:hypothetical protein